jgi:hypothetical protein
VDATGDEVEFITIMLWDSIDAIRAVARADYEISVIPDERRKYLSREISALRDCIKPQRK